MKQFIHEPPVFREPTEFRNHQKLFVRYSIPYSKRMVESFVEWAKREHWAAIQYFSSKGKFKTVKYLTEEFSPIRLLSMLDSFSNLCDFLRTNEDVWNSIGRQDRKFISAAYDFSSTMNR